MQIYTLKMTSGKIFETTNCFLDTIFGKKPKQVLIFKC